MNSHSPDSHSPNSHSTDSHSPIDEDFDVVVIGAGSGGLTVAVGLARFGKSVALVERLHVGGDCTNVGCIPSKSLLHLSAHVEAADPAIAAGVLDRVRHRRDGLRHREEEEFGNLENVTLIAGDATLLDADRVQVEGKSGTRVLAAGHIVVATGSRPRRIDLGVDADRLVTNEELFELAVRPERLAIVGAGPVGLEMALAFARLGTEVTVIEQGDQVAPGVFREAAGVVQRHLESHGVEMLLGVRADGSLPAIARADKILLAVGRQPNSEGLGLEVVGVELDEQRRIKIDGRGRTSAKGVWATGDVADRTGTTHGANAWARRIIKSIVAPPAPIGAEPVEPRVIFTDPELASIGEQPETVPVDVHRIRFELTDADRGYTDELDDGLVIVDVRRLSGKILGATIVGPRAGELISVFALAMHTDIPLRKWYGTVWPYPTYADALGRVVDIYMSEAMGSIPGDAVKWIRGRISAVFGRRTRS